MEDLDKQFNVSREFHIPYLAGYSNDGETIYIDKRMPTGFRSTKGAKAGRWVPTDSYLVLHEAIEKNLESTGMRYQFRHHATS